MATHENSVLMNLEALFMMEADRRAEEAAAKERAAALEAARVEAERQARERELDQARLEERRRAEEERARRDAVLEERLRTLRDELSEVRAQREEMHQKVAAIAARPVGSPARRSGLVSLMAAASLIAAVAATAVAWPRDEVRLAQLDVPASVEHEVAAVDPIAGAPIEVEPEPVAAVEQPIEPVAVVADSRDRRRVREPRPHRVREPRGLTEQLELGDGNEVLSDDFLRGAGTH